MPLKENLLMVFVKLPVPGRVKTRLAKVIGNEGAAEAYQQLVARVAEQISHSEESAIWVVFDPPEREQEVAVWLEPLFLQGIDQLVPQFQGDLGQRLAAAFKVGFEAGFKKIAVIGTDCPYLTAAGIEDGWRKLEKADVVFGPAEDGGYYLLGTRGYHPELFTGIPWSSAETLSTSIAAADRAELIVSKLGVLSDVDEIEQWQEFIESGSN